MKSSWKKMFRCWQMGVLSLWRTSPGAVRRAAPGWPPALAQMTVTAQTPAAGLGAPTTTSASPPSPSGRAQPWCWQPRQALGQPISRDPTPARPSCPVSPQTRVTTRGCAVTAPGTEADSFCNNLTENLYRYYSFRDYSPVYGTATLGRGQRAYGNG